MRVVIRVDSSVVIGSGHLMRCLTLAEQLRGAGTEVSFVSREHVGNCMNLIEERNFVLERLPAPKIDGSTRPAEEDYAAWLGVDFEVDAGQTQDFLTAQSRKPDWLIVDHYGLGLSWEEIVSPTCRRSMVIDDLANRHHECDLLLDTNLNEVGESRYAGLVPEKCRLLTGPRYALLRPEFVTARDRIRSRDGHVKRILISLGGVDSGGYTRRACEVVATISDHNFEVDVVMGGNSPQREAVQAFCSDKDNFHFHCQTDRMAELMNMADLAIGAGGTTTWERAWLGLPTIILPVADNQLEGSQAMAAAGAAWMIDRSELGLPESLLAAIRRAINNPDQVVRTGQAAQALFGDQPTPGVSLVVQAMEEGLDAQA